MPGGPPDRSQEAPLSSSAGSPADESVTVSHGSEKSTFLAGTEVLIGRSRDAQVRIDDQRVSRRHATVRRIPLEGWVLEDVGSKAGVYVGSRRIDRLVIDDSVTVHLADPVAGPVVTINVTEPSPASAKDVHLPDQAGITTVGRGSGNDVVVEDLLVSRRHAEVAKTLTGWRLKDLGSRNGTFVDGHRIDEADMAFGQRITLGQTDFLVTEQGLAPWPVEDFPSLEAASITIRLQPDLVLLDRVTFSIAPNSLMAVVGPTGSGKSTLLRSLTGSQPPNEGAVLYMGHDLYAEYDSTLRRLGYVPQDDVLHPELTVRQTLQFGAELRFPPDVSRKERKTRIDELLQELGLSQRADVQVAKLSGGQRKRTSVALELLTKPAVLFLDEPTSGLDPGFEKAVMELLRRLATGGRTVVVVTHSIQSLSLCDRVLFLGPGGRIAYFGPPHEALTYFGRSDFADVFQGLESGQIAPVRLSGSKGRRRERATLVPLAPPPQLRWRRQLWMLLRRQLAILMADRRVLAYLLAEMLIPAFLILALVGRHALSAAKGTAAGSAQTLVGAVVVAAAVIGAANAVREIVKETALYRRERTVGLNRSAYLTAKILVVAVITIIQVSLLAVIATRGSGGPTRFNVLGPPLLEFAVDVSLAAVAAVGLGLLISALVSSSEKAMAVIPVIFVVQWLFSGMVLNLQSKPVLKEAAYLTSANWGFAAAASTADLCRIQREQESSLAPPTHLATAPAGCQWRWRTGRVQWFVDIGALVVLVLLSMFGANQLLKRKEPVRHRRRITSLLH
jgi:ABC-type multidrug transport system ATPase subunit/pSer/pThr/pTyr-binding forkhead associated (FHA) protein